MVLKNDIIHSIKIRLRWIVNTSPKENVINIIWPQIIVDLGGIDQMIEHAHIAIMSTHDYCNHSMVY